MNLRYPLELAGWIARVCRDCRDVRYTRDQSDGWVCRSCRRTSGVDALGLPVESDAEKLATIHAARSGLALVDYLTDRRT
ncbi:MAG: hypothetical protein ACRDMV_25195 [Streptosporangiales bacterium]